MKKERSRHGSYRERRFKIRLSTAVCRDETSVFTKLSDTKRILMVLDGAVELCHESGKTVRLCPGDQDAFSGGEKTVRMCLVFTLSQAVWMFLIMENISK